MSCRDYEFDGPTRSMEDIRKKLDTRSAQLARAMELLDCNGMLRHVTITVKMRSWYRQHKEEAARAEYRARHEKSRADKIRKLKVSALSKLTPAEREALKL